MDLLRCKRRCSASLSTSGSTTLSEFDRAGEGSRLKVKGVSGEVSLECREHGMRAETEGEAISVGNTTGGDVDTVESPLPFIRSDS